MNLAVQNEVGKKDEKGEVINNKKDLGVFFKKVFIDLTECLGKEEIGAKVINFMSLPDEMAKAELVLDSTISNKRLTVLLKICLAEIESLEEADFCQVGAEGCLEYKWNDSTLLILFTNASSSNKKIYFNCYLH